MKNDMARTLQVGWQGKPMSLSPNYLRRVHPAITAVTLVLLALTLVGTLTATGLLP